MDQWPASECDGAADRTKHRGSSRLEFTSQGTSLICVTHSHQTNKQTHTTQKRLKVLFNNVSTLKNLSCMALHPISVFDKV